MQLYPVNKLVKFSFTFIPFIKSKYYYFELGFLTVPMRFLLDTNCLKILNCFHIKINQKEKNLKNKKLNKTSAKAANTVKIKTQPVLSK